MDARAIALEILYQVEAKEAYSNVQLNHALEKYNPSSLDRNLIATLVYGVLRRQNTLDWLIGQYSKKKIDKMTIWIRNILRMGVYQLLYLDKIPHSAACNEATKLAKKKGHIGVSRFVNGIMRNIARNLDKIEWPKEEKEYLSIYYSHPLWLVEHWLGEFGLNKTKEICQADNETPPVYIRVNSLKDDIDTLKGNLEKEGLKTEISSLLPSFSLKVLGGNFAHTAYFKKGFGQIQDESSMLVALVLNAQKGEKILDMCSAPGGKTTHIAETMGNDGEIIANEIKESKLSLIKENCSRLGIKIVKIENKDGRELSALYENKMDKVLLDAPCSGTGVLRRKPDARWKKSLDMIDELVELQRELLESAAKCVKDGGVLVYSTCSIESSENKEQVERFLADHQEFVLEDIVPYLPENLQCMVEKKGMLQLYPGEHDGFFICRMKKKIKR